MVIVMEILRCWQIGSVAVFTTARSVYVIWMIVARIPPSRSPMLVGYQIQFCRLHLAETMCKSNVSKILACL